ncbi:hypothetical protein O1Q_29238, partial [Pseudomonas aeruginosa MPAO1/P2]
MCKLDKSLDYSDATLIWLDKFRYIIHSNRCVPRSLTKQLFIQCISARYITNICEIKPDSIQGFVRDL